MGKLSFNAVCEYIKPVNMPDKFAGAYEKWSGEGHVVGEKELDDILVRYSLTDEQSKRLHGYLRQITDDEKISDYIKFLVWTQCDIRRYEYFIDCDNNLNGAALGELGETLEFFMLLSCIAYARIDLENRMIPKELYEQIPYRMLDEIIGRYKEKETLRILDIPWKLNFFSLSIYLFDRFLFVPCKFDDPFYFYRGEDGEVIGVAMGGLNVDDMGQLIPDDEELSDPNGEKNGYYYGRFSEKRKTAFTTTFKETDTEIIGSRISPCGTITTKSIILSKEKYKKILERDDWMIGFHIPSGDGYTPQRVRNSMTLAWKFFEKYYPEIPFKGFWSSSWLYDGRLSTLLPDDSRIVRVQRQFFNYTGGWNGESTYYELFGDAKLLIDEVPQESSLQRKLAQCLKDGKKFIDTGMVYFPEELNKDYNRPIYITDEDLKEQDELYVRTGWKGGTS
ncbi:hypothetical protein [Butyrivibrio sp. INlla21]|uniref:hypothetical protein n=1 Tax=Butyrivibrio sp. INlla21 TaxID=1520811 RepID=UPI0008EED4E6|nr:hypothetical protein [Butyrivibrio sp. INlla21]SFU83897.1 hypothetical protein SAMN02910342_01980 [Butyrivibrio sp. INlla21]